jgi:hypothetical protein
MERAKCIVAEGVFEDGCGRSGDGKKNQNAEGSGVLHYMPGKYTF